MNMNKLTNPLNKKVLLPFLLFSASCLLITPATCFASDFAGSLKGVSITDAEGINTPPVASFTYSIEGNTVTFDASNSTDPDGSIVKYNWDFGDNSYKEGQTVTYEYSTILNKGVTLTVIDNLNGIALTQDIIGQVACNSIPFYDTASSATNTYKTGADEYYALSGGLWKGPDKTLCGIEFYIASITGDISSKTFTVQIYSTDSNNSLQTLKGTSDEIQGSILVRGWTNTIQFPAAISISSGDAIVIAGKNNILDSSNFITLAEDNTKTGDFNEGIWGENLTSKRLWARAVLAKLYE